MIGRSGNRASQRGVVLIIALILVGVVAVSTAMAMRLSMFGDQLSQNMRAQSLALQAAEAGLRHCERLVSTARATTLMLGGAGALAPDAPEWTDEALWQSTGHEVPEVDLGTDVRYRVRPRCLIRHMTLAEFRGDDAPARDAVTAESRGVAPDRLNFYRITARGYSPDFRPNGFGAEVWLQSMMRSVE